MTFKSRRALLLIAALPLMFYACSQDDSSPAAAPDEANDWIDDDYRKNLDIFADDPMIQVGRGLLADKKHRYIDLLATATGAGPDTQIDTFIVSDSGESGSALAITPVRPDEVQRALEFIGMTAGHPMDMSNTYYWPKGERVTITYYWNDAEAGRFNQSVRAEKLITDLNWNEHLPELGFRFVGPSKNTGASPPSILIATTYNTQNSILEVPYIVDRRELAGRLVGSTEYRIDSGTKLRIRIRPEFATDQKRVYEFFVDISPGDGDDADRVSNLGVVLRSADESEVISGEFVTVYAYLEALTNDGKEPFLQLRFSDTLSVQSAGDVSRFARQFLIEQDIRIAPNSTHLFYSAFLPSESWRDPNRRNRSSQPLEIHLGVDNDAEAFSGEIIQHTQSSVAGATQRSFGSIGELQEAIEHGQPWTTDGAFIITSPALSYGEIRVVFDLIREDFPNFYVFM